MEFRQVCKTHDREVKVVEDVPLCPAGRRGRSHVCRRWWVVNERGEVVGDNEAGIGHMEHTERRWPGPINDGERAYAWPRSWRTA